MQPEIRKLVTYDEAVRAFMDNPHLGDSERGLLMGGNLSRIYHWTPTPA